MRRRNFLLTPVAAIPASAASTPAAAILGAALSDTQGWQRLEHLCYRIGNRLVAALLCGKPSNGPPTSCARTDRKMSACNR
ncbi:MAG: hypothetical protein R2748_16440 [Bryobacterales bacterium]